MRFLFKLVGTLGLFFIYLQYTIIIVFINCKSFKMGHSVKVKQIYYMKQLLQHTSMNYDKYNRHTYLYRLKLIAFHLCIRFCCSLCEWNSGHRKFHYVRSEYTIFSACKILLPPFAYKIRLHEKCWGSELDATCLFTFSKKNCHNLETST
jgi:hypothetical protein